MKPMLAATVKDSSQIKFPVYASPKLDGIRGVVVNNVLKSRTLKDIPNPFVSARFSDEIFDGLDGELILGEPTAKDVYRQTNGACARHDGEPDVKFYVFDVFRNPDDTYKERLASLAAFANNEHVVVLEQVVIDDLEELNAYEENMLNEGYEGVILRTTTGFHSGYKFGRSTMKQQGMMKLKRFVDSEFILTKVEEEEQNTNEKKVNELGRSKRSSHQAGKVGKGCAGTLVGFDTKSNVVVRCGSGLDAEDRKFFWTNKDALITKGVIVKYKSFQIGVKDLPRHPVFLGLRESWDI